MKALVICSGNICRSPMVEAYLRHRLNRSGLSHVVVSSAGTLGIAGAPASGEAVRAMAEIDIDLRTHRSRALGEVDVITSDWILAMDFGHLETLAVRFPRGHGERHLIRAFEAGPAPAADAPDLDDPVGGPLQLFREQREVIRVCIDHFVLHIKHPAPSS